MTDPGRPRPGPSLGVHSVGTAPIVKLRIPGAGPSGWKKFATEEEPKPPKVAELKAPVGEGEPALLPESAVHNPNGGPSDRIGAHYNDTHAGELGKG